VAGLGLNKHCWDASGGCLGERRMPESVPRPEWLADAGLLEGSLHVDADGAQAALEAFDDKWGSRFPVITQAWLNAWEYMTPFLAFPPELRRVVYTTNAIEALNRQLRKAIKTKGHFLNEEAARKLIYLAITNAVPAWTRTRNWTTALLAFKIHFGTDYPSEPPTQKIGRPPRTHRGVAGGVHVGARVGATMGTGDDVVALERVTGSCRLVADPAEVLLAQCLPDGLRVGVPAPWQVMLGTTSARRWPAANDARFRRTRPLRLWPGIYPGTVLAVGCVGIVI
jgi:hypothetical protein